MLSPVKKVDVSNNVLVKRGGRRIRLRNFSLNELYRYCRVGWPLFLGYFARLGLAQFPQWSRASHSPPPQFHAFPPLFSAQSASVMSPD
jgi:hypothetical protein